MNPFKIFEQNDETYQTSIAFKQDKKPKWRDIIIFKSVKGEDEIYLFVKTNHASSAQVFDISDDDMSDSEWLLNKYINNNEEINQIKEQTEIRQKQLNMDTNIKYVSKEIGAERTTK